MTAVHPIHCPTCGRLMHPAAKTYGSYYRWGRISHDLDLAGRSPQEAIELITTLAKGLAGAEIADDSWEGSRYVLNGWGPVTPAERKRERRKRKRKREQERLRRLKVEESERALYERLRAKYGDAQS